MNFVRQLILLCVHLIFLTTAIFLRNPKDDQPLAQKIFCHIAEVCVIIGCSMSIFVLQAKEIYLQGFNYYIQNLVGELINELKFLSHMFLDHLRKAIQKNFFINALVY